MQGKSATSKPQNEQVESVPPVFNIKKSTEPGFDLETCMKDVKVPETLEDLSDSYFDSYSHFAIHEEMLKDKVTFSKFIVKS